MDQPPQTARPERPTAEPREQLDTPPEESPQPWSVEHYGFEEVGRPAPSYPGVGPADADLRPRTAPQQPVQRVPEAPSGASRPRRIRVVLGAAALALVLSTGGAGFAVAQAIGNGPDRAAATGLAGGVPGGGGDHGPRTGFGTHR
jgi:hypothetical protein